MPSIFSRIVAGDIPSYKVAEDDRFFAFLDINPLVEGHTLVIPKKEVDRLWDLDQETYRDLFLFSKRVAHAIEAAIPCDRVGVAVIGLEVPHAHIHLAPINGLRDMDFTRPKLQVDNARMVEIAELINSHFS